jgi:hypothetical protein
MATRTHSQFDLSRAVGGDRRNAREPGLRCEQERVSRHDCCILIMAGTLSGAAKPDSKNGIPHRTLGRTREKVSLIGLGGYHLAQQSDPDESIRIIRTGIDEGINFLDNCWDYNDGESETRMGRALRDGYRQKAFLMTKIDGRNKAAAARPTRSIVAAVANGPN